MDILCDFLSPTFYPPNFYPQANSQIALLFTGSKKSHIASKYDFLPPKRQKCNAAALTTGDLTTAYNLHPPSSGPAHTRQDRDNWCSGINEDRHSNQHADTT